MSKGLASWIIEEGARAVGQVARSALSGRRSQEVVARAVGAAQRGLHAMEGLQEAALHAVGLAAKPDYEEVRKRLARIKRKVRGLDRRVPGGDPGAGGEGGESR
jgi:hypothetical protein